MRPTNRDDNHPQPPLLGSSGLDAILRCHGHRGDMCPQQRGDVCPEHTAGARPDSPLEAVTEEHLPLLIVCHEDPGCINRSQTAAVRRRFDAVLYFPTAPSFTRWLFSQERGDVVPWCVLLTGWREARPCAAAISAVRSGKSGNLRIDAKRPTLREPRGGDTSRIGTAVAAMIVSVSRGRQEQVASEWAPEGSAMAGLPLQIANSDGQVAQHLATLAHQMTVRITRLSV
mmetsp:Transcript_2609/g.6086  ORF Transcript_2609/g.6086 Transcript_2609/m.6086 type:complete len:229 (+) Transcript_2609:73-759(+)